MQEISKNPKFFVGGASRFDVRQGELGKLTYILHIYTIYMYCIDCSVCGDAIDIIFGMGNDEK